MKKASEKEFREQLKTAQPRTYDIWKSVYVPQPHPYADRIAENKKIPSLWTPNKIEGSRK